MEALCGGTFWNSSLLLDNTWPELTPCFLDFIITSLPCFMFWLVVPCHVYNISTNHVSQHYPMSWLCVSKLACGSMTVLMSVLQIVDHVADVRASAATFLGDGILLLTLLAATLMTQFERRKGVITSSTLFIFWTFKTICDIVPLYTMIMLEKHKDSLGEFTKALIRFMLTIAMTIFYAFADPEAVSRYKSSCDTGENICPEATSSFLSRFSFFWFNKLIWTGYKRGVEMRDIWDLTPRDRSTTVVPAFERLWSQELERCSSIKGHQQKSIYKSSRTVLPSRQKPGEYLTLKEGERDEPPSYSGYSTWKRLRDKRNGSTKTTKFSYNSNSESDHASSDDYATEKTKLISNKKKPGLTSVGSHSHTRPSLVHVLIRQFGGPMAVCLIQRLMSDLMLLCCPLVLGLLISHLNERKAGREWQGYVLAGMLMVCGIGRSVFYSCANYRAYYVGLQLRSVLIGAVFNKALRISNEAKKKATSGEITSLMSVDTQRLQEFISRLFFGMTIPVILFLVIVIMYFYVGPSALSSIVIIVIVIPATGIAGICQKKAQEKLLVYKDQRVKLFNEILNGIKVLKLYAWEVSFQQRVTQARSQELHCLWRVALLYIVLGLCTNMMSFLMTLATYGTYVLSQPDNFLNPSAAFVIMALLNILTPTLDFMGMLISFFVQAKVSAKRINDFLCSEDLDDSAVTRTQNTDVAIQIQRGNFAWDLSSSPTLKNINVKINTGRLMAVVGTVGAGKSSLIQSFMGELYKLTGTVTVKGSVAYVAQQAWIQNATVRDNVLFGQTHRHDRYTAVIKACQLERDLQILMAGDLTEIGEKGTNLSGGQKQRVSLARAVYSDSDVYLLDDPLSAVDSHVGKAIFNDVVGPRGLLKGKTRVLVTHGVHWLPLVDEIVVMKEGEISEVGSYTELMKHGGDFAQFLKTYLTQRHNEGSEEEEDSDNEVAAMKQKILTDVESVTTDTEISADEKRALTKRYRRRNKRERNPLHNEESRSDLSRNKIEEAEEGHGKLILTEKVVKGQVPVAIYLHYPRAAGMVALILAVLCFASFRAASVGGNFWLRQWTGDPTLANQSTWGSEAFVNTNKYYLTVYGVFGIFQVVLLVAYNALYWTRTVQASRHLHDAMIDCLLRAPMAFFDTTPMGRIMNRVSSDMEIVDNLMPQLFRDIVSIFSLLLATVTLLVIVSPLSITILLPLAIFCYFALKAYIPTSRQCRRMEAVTRSPVFAHFSETISGAATIRAYGATKRFIAQSKIRVDTNQKCYFAYIAGLRWSQLVMDSAVNVVIFTAALLEVVSPGSSGGSVGLSVSYAMQLMCVINYLVRQLVDFDTNMVSVERMKEYSEIPSEAAWINPLMKATPGWPDEGEMELKNYRTRYRPGLDLVLKGVSCHIKGGEKIGIVGRTGAGKSSLSLALFRVIEASGGSIIIDGVNIADIGLHDLRSRLTILPQDPVLFSGSLRFNVDPFGEYEDHQVWKALEQAHLRQFVSSLPEQLHFECGEEGLNLSVGQRQLVCLARTLLRKTRVLVLDEATAAVDMETDALIQSTVRQAFRQCTILTIAHRLNTIMDYDRILVLDGGTVCEFDSPHSLLEKPDSLFTAMLKDAGLA